MFLRYLGFISWPLFIIKSYARPWSFFLCSRDKLNLRMNLFFVFSLYPRWTFSFTRNHLVRGWPSLHNLVLKSVGCSSNCVGCKINEMVLNWVKVRITSSVSFSRKVQLLKWTVTMRFFFFFNFFWDFLIFFLNSFLCLFVVFINSYLIGLNYSNINEFENISNLKIEVM